MATCVSPLLSHVAESTCTLQARGCGERVQCAARSVRRTVPYTYTQIRTRRAALASQLTRSNSTSPFARCSLVAPRATRLRATNFSLGSVPPANRCTCHTAQFRTSRRAVCPSRASGTHSRHKVMCQLCCLCTRRTRRQRRSRAHASRAPLCCRNRRGTARRPARCSSFPLCRHSGRVCGVVARAADAAAAVATAYCTASRTYAFEKQHTRRTRIRKYGYSSTVHMYY